MMSTWSFSQNKAQNLIAENISDFSNLKEVSPFVASKSFIPKSALGINGDVSYLDLKSGFTNSVIKSDEETLKLTIPIKNKKANLLLKEVEVLTPDYITTTSSGSKLDEYSQNSKFYWGTIEGLPSSTVVFNVFNNEVSASIDLGDQTFTLGKAKNSQSYILYEEKNLEDQNTPSCSTKSQDIDIKFPHINQKSEGPNNCVRVYMEVDNDIYNHFGSTQSVMNYILGAFSQVTLLYENEDVNVRLNQVLIWDTTDPYNGPSSEDYLVQFSSELNPDFNGDIAHLVGFRGGGGIAYVDVLCKNVSKTAYSAINTTYKLAPTFSWTVNVIAHEIGHNLGSPHTHDCSWNGNNTQIDDCGNVGTANPTSCYNANNPIIPSQGGTIMSYCHLSNTGIDFNLGFGTQPGDLIRSRVYAAQCLTSCGSCPEFGTPCDDNNACTINDAIDSYCNCTGVMQDDFDQDGICANEDPDDSDPCIPQSCNDCSLTTITIIPDRYPSEISWEIIDAQGNIVFEGADYTADVSQSREICIDPGCYDFIIRDSYGDGICCEYGQGSYTLTDTEGTVLATGGDYAASETVNLCFENTNSCNIGEACNDGNDCTTGDSLDANCNCVGTFQDADNDGVCDANDICPGGDDSIDSDNDGTPDACDNCSNAGAACNDGNPCTVNDQLDANCNCIGTYQDSDDDGVCDANDICPGGNDNIDTDDDGTPDDCDSCSNTGAACNDGDPCTSNDRIDANCNCVGTFQDSDDDGVCDADDICPGGDDNIDLDNDGTPDACDNCTNAGQICDDGDACTTNDRFDSDCNCIGTYQDSDNDGVCDADDICPNGDDSLDADNDGTPDACDDCSLLGQSCEDGNPCTINDKYDANCNCVGTFNDSDNDGVCDANDICPGGDDNIDTDNDGTPDACDNCNNAGQSCDDNNECTINDQYDANCNCVGTFNDSDNDGVCDANDQCPEGDDTIDIDNDGTPDACDDCTLLGQSCNDNNPCTINDKYDANCNCAGTIQDSDNDGVCDAEDICPGGDDNIDLDNDGTPDACDNCVIAGQSCDDNNPCTINDRYNAHCECEGTFQDSDNDTVCDAFDICPGGDDLQDIDNDNTPDACDDCTTVGESCDDGNACTINDKFDANCNCVGTFQDADNDGVCDAEDVCQGGNDNVDIDNDDIPDFCDDCIGNGQSCDDGNPCTINDRLDENCNCVGTFQDSDDDGVCDADDICPGGDDNNDSDNDGTPDACDDCSLAGQSCDDGDACTTNDKFDINCNCVGNYADEDEDGVCDALDICSNGDDNIDSDNDGTPDACDDCNQAGDTCDDGDDCTVNDRYDNDCNCIGQFLDSDNDGVCNEDDVCPGSNDFIDSDGDNIPNGCDDCNNDLVNLPCDDNNECTIDDKYDINCNCVGTFIDSDNDNVCDAFDICPNGDDSIDSNNNGIPDDCELDCMTHVTEFENSELEHSGESGTSTLVNFNGPVIGAAFTVYGLDMRTFGRTSRRYIEGIDVIIQEKDGPKKKYASYNATEFNTVNIVINQPVISIEVILSDVYDGESLVDMAVSLSDVSYCIAQTDCQDDDNDGICNEQDVCPGGDDNLDTDTDGNPDACDDCLNETLRFDDDILSHSGSGFSNTTIQLDNHSNPSFSITEIDYSFSGNRSRRYVDIVEVLYVNDKNRLKRFGRYSGRKFSEVDISIPGTVKKIIVRMKNGRSNSSALQSIRMSDIDVCSGAVSADLKTEISSEIANNYKPESRDLNTYIYPNPNEGLFNLKINSTQEIGLLNIQIINPLGERCFNNKYEINSKEHIETIDLSRYPAGLYYVKIKYDGQQSSSSFMKIN